jgi:hypothetical protein
MACIANVRVVWRAICERSGADVGGKLNKLLDALGVVADVFFYILPVSCPE